MFNVLALVLFLAQRQADRAGMRENERSDGRVWKQV